MSDSWEGRVGGARMSQEEPGRLLLAPPGLCWEFEEKEKQYLRYRWAYGDVLKKLAMACIFKEYRYRVEGR